MDKKMTYEKAIERLEAIVSELEKGKLTLDESVQLFEEGADKKAWVLTMIQSTADQLDYKLTEQDMRNLSDLIDTLCDMSKVVNVEGEDKDEEAAE